MGNIHREQAGFDRARWRIFLLGPFWFLQIVLLLSLMAVFSYRLAETADLIKEQGTESVPTIKLIWEIANVAFSLVSLGLNMIEIAKFVAETLTPFIMLLSHIFKAALAIAVLGLDINVLLENLESRFTVIGLVIDGALLLCTFVPTVYSIFVYVRGRKYDAYHHPVNVKPYGFTTPTINTPADDSTLEFGDKRSSATYYPDTGDTSYAPYYAASIHGGGSTRSRLSMASMASSVGSPTAASRSDRRVSSGSSIFSFNSSGQQQQHERLDVAPSPSRETYTHERSTAFDEYVKRRSLVAGDVPASPASPLAAPAPAAAAVASPVGGASVRCVSWSSTRGSLMVVPEGEEDEGSRGYGGGRGGGGIRSPDSASSSVPGPSLGLGLASPTYYGDRRRRAGSAASDRQGLLADVAEIESGDLGSRSRTRTP